MSGRLRLVALPLFCAAWLALLVACGEGHREVTITGPGGGQQPAAGRLAVRLGTTDVVVVPTVSCAIDAAASHVLVTIDGRAAGGGSGVAQGSCILLALGGLDRTPSAGLVVRPTPAQTACTSAAACGAGYEV